VAESKVTVYVAMAANLCIAVAKFVAAAFSGSSAMLSEGIHSLVDTANNALLLVGIHRSKRPPDAAHPFGHGHDLYFYALLVAVVIFGAGGAVSAYEGVLHVLHPVPIEDPRLAYAVIAIAAVVESISETVAVRNFMRVKGDQPFWTAIRTSKDPTTFIVLFEDAAALAGLLIATAGVYLSTSLSMPVLDGVASILIGLVLCAVALIVLRETKGLLLGEAVQPDVLQRLRELLADDPAVHAVGRVMTMHIGPHQILVNAELQFEPSVGVTSLPAIVNRIEHRLRAAYADISNVFIEPTGEQTR
jgi:cation diffusion facilitator family transporter